jgi:citrate lyase beta subunit
MDPEVTSPRQVELMAKHYQYSSRLVAEAVYCMRALADNQSIGRGTWQKKLLPADDACKK